MAKQSGRHQLRLVDAISQAREAAGLSQRQLSALLREGVTFVQRIESGSRDVTVAEFVSIADALDVDPTELLRRALR